MSLLWMDGFEWDTPTTVLSSDGAGTRGLYSYEVRNITNDTDIVPGRTGGAALRILDNDYIEKQFTNTDDTIVLGCAFETRDFDSNINAIEFYEGANLGLNIRLDDHVMVVRRGTTILGTYNQPFRQSIWCYLEVKVVVDNSAGSFEIRVNGQNVASESSIDTQPGSNSYYNRFRLKGSGSTVVSYTYDDLYLLNGAGSANNDFLGSVKVETLYPDGAGNSSDLTPSTGSNYQNVDENPEDDGDSTYNESSTSNDKDLYTYDNTSLDTINAVQINSIVRETDANPFSIHNVTRSGGADYDSSSQAIGGTSYLNINDIRETDPDTASAWTDTALNAAEFGIKVA